MTAGVVAAVVAVVPGATQRPAGAQSATAQATPSEQGPSGGPSDVVSGDATAATGGVDIAFPPTLPTGWPQPPVGTARAVFAIDADSGQVLASRNPDQRVEVASTIKLVTALTARRVYELDQPVTVGQEVAIGGSTAALEPGDTWTVRELLLGMLLRSGNDAAEALAAAGGDRAGFITEMDATVRALGIEGATITEPSGLEDTNLLSARDLVVLGRAVLADPVLAEMVATESGSLPSTGVVPNRNLLLGRLDNAVGIKTGTTDLAGASLVGAAVWQARTVVTAVLGTVNDTQRYEETEALMRWIDDIGVHEVAVGGRVRFPGTWLGERTTLALWSPTAPEGRTNVAVDGSVAATDVRVGDEQVAEAVVVADPDAVAAAVPRPASMGQAATATIYDALRQAVALHVIDVGADGG